MILEEIKQLILSNLDDILSGRLKRTLKADGSFVTEGDLLCQKLVFDYARNKLPDYMHISEELDMTGFVYDPNGNYIVIDPIDGTENFTSGLKEWGVSVSIYEKDKHKESMLLLPELGLSAMTGDTAIYPQFDSRIEGISSTNLSGEFRDNLVEGSEYRLTGCAVLGMYNVVTGSYKGFVKPKNAKMWDILAGLNLALEQGLSVMVNGKKYQGEFLLPTEKYSFEIRKSD